MADIDYGIRQGGSFVDDLHENRYIKLVDSALPFAPWERISPLTALLGRIGGDAKWQGVKQDFGQRHGVPFTVKSETALAAAATIDFETKDWPTLRATDLLINNRTGEMIKITATPSSATVSVTRGYAGTTAADVNDADEWTRGPNVQQEDAGSIDTIGSTPNYWYNVVQEFEHPFKATNRLIAIGKAGGNIGLTEMDLLDEDSRRDHEMAKEVMLWRGQRYEGAKGETTMGGIEYFMNMSGSHATTDDLSSLTDFTYEDLEELTHDPMSYNPGEQYVLWCGRTFWKKFQSWPKDKFIMNTGMTEYGWKFKHILLTHGTVDVQVHPMFARWGWDDKLCLMPVRQIKKAGILDRSTTHLDTGEGGKGIQARDVRYTKYRYMCEMSLEFHALDRWGFWSGLGLGF